MDMVKQQIQERARDTVINVRNFKGEVSERHGGQDNKKPS